MKKGCSKLIIRPLAMEYSKDIHFSPFLLCISLIFLFIELKHTDYGYKTDTKNVSPILYRQFKVICGKWWRFKKSTKH